MGSPRSPVPLFIIVPRKSGEPQLGLCRLLRAELGFMLVPAFHQGVITIAVLSDRGMGRTQAFHGKMDGILMCCLTL